MMRHGYMDMDAAIARSAIERKRRQAEALVVRRSVAECIDRAKQIVQDHPGDTAALLEVTIALIGCVSPHFVGQSLYPLVTGEDVGEQQVDDGLLSGLDHPEPAFQVVHSITPAADGEGVNGGGEA